MAKQSAEKQKLKKLFIVSLIIWLGALPFLAVIQIVLRFILTAVGSPDAVIAVVNAVSYLMGFYVLFGWIPAVAIFSKYQSKK